MANKIFVLLEDKRNILKKIWYFFSQHKDTVNAISTVVLIFVTLVLILVSIYSIFVSNQLKDMQINFLSFQEKKETAEQIEMANRLLEEVNDNRGSVIQLIPRLNSLINTSESIDGKLNTVRIRQAIDMMDFGTDPISEQLPDYLRLVDFINDGLDDIKRANEARNTKVRGEQIGTTLKFSRLLLNGTYFDFNLEQLVTDLETYAEEREDYYQKIDKEIEKELLQKIE